MGYTGHKPPPDSGGAIAGWDQKPPSGTPLHTANTPGSGAVAAWLPENQQAAPIPPRWNPTSHAPKSVPADHRVIVSMTSIPARNGTLGQTIESLLAQSRPPDEIRLYIGDGCEEVGGVTCIRVEDRGPVTKLSAIADPAVPMDAIVVTADDDIAYHPDWLFGLLSACVSYPDEAVGYAGWDAEVLMNTGIRERALGPCDVIEGFGGVAYRKWFFGPDVLDPPEEIRWVDDVWISVYLHRAGIVRRVIPGGNDFVDVRRSEPSGIHTRPDFDLLNRRAAGLFAKSAERAALDERRAKARGVR